jgi:hypothetical protein
VFKPDSLDVDVTEVEDRDVGGVYAFVPNFTSKISLSALTRCAAGDTVTWRVPVTLVTRLHPLPATTAHRAPGSDALETPLRQQAAEM